tara:strand:+ start:179 stop:421 length:243 start_codon:yes stop_codon:yes gene_type:complete
MTDEKREAQAKRLLEDTLFKEAFDTLEKDIMDTWSSTGIDDGRARETCWLSIRLLSRIKVHLTSIVETGEMAKKLQEYQL